MRDAVCRRPITSRDLQRVNFAVGEAEEIAVIFQESSGRHLCVRLAGFAERLLQAEDSAGSSGQRTQPQLSAGTLTQQSRLAGVDRASGSACSSWLVFARGERTRDAGANIEIFQWPSSLSRICLGTVPDAAGR